MINRRELILARISAITLTVQASGIGIVTAVRNRGSITSDKRPATVLLDGDETVFTNIPQKTWRPDGAGIKPNIMRMSPQLFVILSEGRPTNDQITLGATTMNVGTALNILRNAIVKAIGDDSELKSLLGANGGIVYNGTVTDLKSGSALTGQMQILMDYIYPFDPTTEGST